jgi:hypothetical protein
MAGRHAQPHHVGERARIAVGHRAEERGCLRGQRRFLADHSLEKRQLPVMITRRPAVEDVPIHASAGEPDADPHACHRGFGKLGRDKVVERPVQMG